MASRVDSKLQRFEAKWQKRMRQEKRKALWDRPFVPPIVTSIAVVVFSVWLGRPFTTFTGTWSWPVILAAVVAMLASSLGLMAFWTIFVRHRILGLGGAADPDLRKMLANQGVLFTLFATTIAAPVAEEFVFRYCLLGALYGHYPLLALVLTGTLFGLMHERLKVPLIAVGLGYACLYIQSGTIWVPILTHGLWNAFVIAIILHTRNKTP